MPMFRSEGLLKSSSHDEIRMESGWTDSMRIS
jgi:hypothetical protein